MKNWDVNEVVRVGKRATLRFSDGSERIFGDILWCFETNDRWISIEEEGSGPSGPDGFPLSKTFAEIGGDGALPYTSKNTPVFLI